MELSQKTEGPQPDEAVPDLAVELLRALCDPGHSPTPDNPKGDRTLQEWQRDAVLDLLNQRGHVLPGCPPAARILRDAQSFAERLTLSNLAVRILNMLAWSTIEHQESRPARRWLENYLEGKGHGPVGQAMLWPANLPGLSQQLRNWGFEPTPTMPPYVMRSLPNPTAQ